MFIDATFEDTRIAASPDGQGYSTTITDNVTGESRTLLFTPTELLAILAINLDPDCTPKGYEDMYKVLEPLLLRLQRAAVAGSDAVHQGFLPIVQ